MRDKCRLPFPYSMSRNHAPLHSRDKITSTMKGKIILSVFIFLFLFGRFYHLLPSLNFGSDQGFGILEMYRLYQTKQITLIGPSSSLSVNGQNIYVSSLVYYLSLLVLMISNWNPLGISYFIILLQLISFLFIYNVLLQRYPHSSLPYFFSILYIFSPTMINYSRFSWAPNYLIPISTVILILLQKLNNKNKSSFLLLLTIGVFLGIGLQFHYSFFLIVMVTFFWIISTKKLNLYYFGLVLSGIVIGFFPIILFEMRHDFHNLRTLLVVFQALGSKGNLHSDFLQLHYFLSLFPFIFFFISYFLAIVYRKNKIIPLVLITGYFILSLRQILPIPGSGFTMPDGWNYEGLLKTRDIILSEKKKEFNIVDLLSGDTRAYALRALLTLAGTPPKDITSYPSSTSLFLYTREPIEKILAGSLWEIDSAKPLRINKKWPIQNGVSLYLLEKSASTSGMVK